MAAQFGAYWKHLIDWCSSQWKVIMQHSLGCAESTEVDWVGGNYRDGSTGRGGTWGGDTRGHRQGGSHTSRYKYYIFPDQVLLFFSWCIWAAAPFVVISFTLGALWPPGEPEEDEMEMEEPKICAPKQAGFDWACTWLEEEGCLHWQKIKLKGYFLRCFGLPRLLPLLFYSGVLFSLFWPLVIFQGYLVFPFFSGFVSTVVS